MTQASAISAASTASTSSTTSPKRYHPALVSLHWLIAILIFGTALLAGDGGEGGERGRQAATGFAGLSTLSIHMILGILILVLLIVRLIIRWRTQRPGWASTGSALLDKVGELTHWALYIFTFGMTITGIILAAQTNRLVRAFGFAPARPTGQFTPGQFPPPGQFREGGEGAFRFGLGRLHGMIWVLLILLILLHIGAALYHQFFIKDNLMGRMWYGKQEA